MQDKYRKNAALVVVTKDFYKCLSVFIAEWMTTSKGCELAGWQAAESVLLSNLTAG